MKFRGKFAFLSNFYACDVYGYASVEHAFQACKTLDRAERLAIRQASTPAEAKRLGKIVKLREDWEGMKLGVMETLLRKKFEDEALMALLRGVEGEIVEENSWGDTFWGVSGGKGRNELGKLLMKIRDG